MLRERIYGVQIIRLDKDGVDKWHDQIVALIIESYSINFGCPSYNSNYGENKYSELLEFLEDGTAVVFLAIEGDCLLGWIWSHRIFRPNTERLHIAEISVDEKYRAKGIGRRLVEEVEKYARENNLKEIDLLVTVKNKSAVDFYIGNNFVSERYLMKKEL